MDPVTAEAVTGRAVGVGVRDWAAIFVMLSSAPAMALSFTAIAPVLQLIAAHFGPAGQPAFAIPLVGIAIDGPLFAQLISTLPSVGLFLGGPPIGLAIDRLGARAVLIWSAIFFALLGAAGAIVDDAGLLLAARLLLGFAAVGYGAATVSLIGARFTDIGRARALAYRNLLGGIGGLLGMRAAGVLGETEGWHGPFALYLIVLLIVPLTLATIPAAPPIGSRLQITRSTESLMHLWPIYATVIALAVVMMMNTAQLSFLLADNDIVSPARQAEVMQMGSIMATVSAFLYSVLGPRFAPRWNYMVIALALGSGAVIDGLSHTALGTGIGTALIGVGAGYLGPHFGRLVLERAPASARGRAVGLNFSATYLGDFLNPFVVRPLAIAFGIHRAYLIVGSLVGASALQIFIRFPSEQVKADRVGEAN